MAKISLKEAFDEGRLCDLDDKEILMASIFYNTLVKSVKMLREYAKEKDLEKDAERLLVAVLMVLKDRNQWPPGDSGILEAGSFFDNLDEPKQLKEKND